MQDFPANSRKAKDRAEEPLEDEQRRVEQVTSAGAKVRKRGLSRKFKETFVVGTARGAVEYMVVDVVVPAIQDTLIDALQGGIERLIKGEGRRRSSGGMSRYSDVGHVNYAGMSSNKPSTPRTLSQKSRARHDFGEIVIVRREEAEDVLDRLYEELSRYGRVTVAVLYELTGIQSSHADQNWGWTALRGAKIRTLRGGGYLLDLPDPEPLSR